MSRIREPAAAFEQFAADRLKRDREPITREWVDRLSGQLGIRPRHVLPTAELLDHIPDVLAKVAAFLVAPDADRLAAHQLVSDEMKHVARLRRRQGYDVQEIIREFDELARILDEVAVRWLEEYDGVPDPRAVGRVFGRLIRSPLLMGEITVGMYREEELEAQHAAAVQLRDFSETLMHQLKTPIAAAEGAAMMLEDGDISSDPADVRSSATLIRRNLARARNVVDDVRTLALAQLTHPDAGRVLPVGEVIDEVLGEVRPVAEASGVRIEVDEPTPHVLVDAARVEIVLLNLISNGVKYADREKQVPLVTVAFEPDRDSERWWIAVSDNGLGIAPDLQERVFERFFRGHPDTAEGSGLGLAIVKEALLQMDSSVEMVSDPGRGTTVKFSLSPPYREDVEA